MFIAAADDLEEEVGGVRIVGEVANLVNREQRGPRVVAEAALEGAGGLLTIEIEQQVRGGDEARGVAGQDDLVDDVLVASVTRCRYALSRVFSGPVRAGLP